jgi:formiminoglutamase
MSGESSSVAEWFMLLDPAGPPADLVRRPDDPRLGEIIEFWDGDLAALRPGRGVIVGFPQDEGVRRNFGRPGAAEAPLAIRSYLWRLVSTAWDSTTPTDLGTAPPLDIGNIRITGSLEDSQEALGRVVGTLLRLGTVPIVLGGGHEAAYGHYLGYVNAGRKVGIINLDAHLDLRPPIDGRGHSGSPFRQAMEYPPQPLAGKHYACLGIQPQAVSFAHLRYAQERGCLVHTAGELQTVAAQERLLARKLERFRKEGCSVYLSIDADVVHERDVPGVSAPNPLGVPGYQIVGAASLAGTMPWVSSVDLVEINPRYDRDNQSARWAALVIWNFLIGLGSRPNR